MFSQKLNRKGKDMSYSQAQNRATQKYVKDNYERLYITVKKGQKDTIKTAAEMQGESMNQYIKTAIEMRVKQDLTE